MTLIHRSPKQMSGCNMKDGMLLDKLWKPIDARIHSLAYLLYHYFFIIHINPGIVWTKVVLVAPRTWRAVVPHSTGNGLLLLKQNTWAIRKLLQSNQGNVISFIIFISFFKVCRSQQLQKLALICSVMNQFICVSW